MSVYCGAGAVDSADIYVCATLMQTHQKPVLNIWGVKQRQTEGGGAVICGDSQKVQTRDDMLNGAIGPEPLTANSQAKFCVHLCRGRPL